MRFVNEIRPRNPDIQIQPSHHHGVPKPPIMLAKPSQVAVSDERGRLTDIDGVAHALGVSKRYVQTLVSRKAIPVIRLGRRCTRFDLQSVLAAVKKFEIEEIGRRTS